MSLRGLLPILTHRPEMNLLCESVLRSKNVKSADSAEPLIVYGMPDAAKAYFITSLCSALHKPVIYIAADDDRARAFTQIAAELRGVRENSPDPAVFLLPSRPALPFERLMANPHITRERMSALLAMFQSQNSKDRAFPNGAPIFAASVRALTQPIIPADEFAAATLAIRPGIEIDFSSLTAKLIALGYESVAEVEEPGQFSKRGGLIDIFPSSRPRPIRIEFFGNTVESARTFDPETQRSLNDAGLFFIPPAHEALPTAGVEAARQLKLLSVAAMYPDALDRWRRDVDMLTERSSFDDIALYLPYLHRSAGLLDYISADAVMVLDDIEHLQTITLDLRDQAAALRQKLIHDGEIPEELQAAWIGWDAIFSELQNHRCLRFSALNQDVAGREAAWGSGVGVDFSPADSFGAKLRAFALEVRKELNERQRVIIVTDQARRISDLFHDEDILGANTILTTPEIDIADPPETGSLTVVYNTQLKEGWKSRSLALTVYTDAEIFGWAKRKTEKKTFSNSAAFLQELKIGDYVVHVDFGIGRFDGLTKITTDGAEREYLLIQYAGTDRLYLPTDRLNLITRYIGMGDAVPTLNKIGGGEWVRAKERASASAKDIAKDLLRLYSAREVSERLPYPSDDQQPWLQELEDSFPFEETPDQARAIEEVKSDMEQQKPMDRLVCGDVGYGKTEVALRAAFKAALDSRQVAILTPTTVLALQHFNTFRERLKNYPLRVELLSRFRSAKEQKDVLLSLALGQTDIVIGTHRLLSKDVVFNNLGLIVIDEEQRFGVEHKERLKQYRTEVDVLTLTATPIPRTLHMALVDVRDMSVIETPPVERLPIRTMIRESDDTIIREAILREIDRGGQVFFVNNRIRGIQQIAQRLEILVPEAKIVVAHGQMDEEKLEKVMLDFAAGNFNVLVCTTIIENGLDIPNANTIIINNAGNFGLSQLYQLRGRVGRGALQAYAYFLYHQGTKLQPNAEKRLRAIYEATELGSGFRIAMKDLEIRGAGNLLGAEQSGNMNSVGFDLYCQLLAEEVAALQGSPYQQSQKTMAEITIDAPISAYIPDSYIPDRVLKIGFYQRIAALQTPEGVTAMQAELEDRFGPAPDSVRYLLGLDRIKLIARDMGFTSVALRNNEWVFRMRPGVTANRVALYKKYKNLVKVELGVVTALRSALPETPSEWIPELEKLLRFIPLNISDMAPSATQ